MRNLLLVCLLLGSLAWGQQEPVPSNAPSENQPPTASDDDERQALPASASKLLPHAAVITIKGLCAPAVSPSTAKASNPPCQTVITRAQFEKLTDALQTNMKPSSRRQFAQTYPKLLAMAKAADARGLEKSPHFQERLAFARLQILSQELVHEIDVESSQISDSDIEDYYNNHSAEFQAATLERIFAPNRKRTDPAAKEKSTAETVSAPGKESEDEMTRVSEELRARAVAGESFSTLQKEAYAAAGMTDVPPNSSLGQVQLAELPPGHSSVLDLKPGEVSKVLSDPTGHYIYKLDSKETDALDKTKEDIIRRVLKQQRKEKTIQAIQKPITVELNPAYFGASEKPSGAANFNSK